jgi:DNA-binding NarL/FixJ family response regulator
VQVTPCADPAALRALPRRPSVVIVDAQTGTPAQAPDDLDSVPTVVLTDGDSHAAGPPTRSVRLPRSASRAALVGAALALAAGLRVVRDGPVARAAGSGSARPGEPAGRPADDEHGWLSELPTARERDVIALAALGLTNRGIAARLGLSEHTVKFHLASIYGKLGARGRTQAVRRAIRRGWIAI